MFTNQRAVAYTCACCGEPIYEGERYWDFGDNFGVFCQTCVDEAECLNAKA